MMTFLVVAAVVALVVFAIARVFFGPGAAVALTALVGWGCGGPPGLAVGVVGGLVLLAVTSLLGALGEALPEPSGLPQARVVAGPAPAAATATATTATTTATTAPGSPAASGPPTA